MAKELHYFKFEPNQWENGNIQIVSRELKGLFIDVCSMYWSRLGNLPFKLAVQKLCAGNATALNSLCNEEIITVIDGDICIHFLNEQLSEFEDLSKQNRKNALDGWKKRRKKPKESDRNATASNPQSENDAIREEKSREDKKRVDKSRVEKKPQYNEVKDYFFEKLQDQNISLVESEKFYDYYTSNGWKVGKSQMKDWKAACRNWIKNIKTYGNSKNTESISPKRSIDRYAQILAEQGYND